MDTVIRSPYEEFPHIITDDVILRKVVDSDSDSIFEIYSNDNVYKYINTDLYTKKKSEMAKTIRILGLIFERKTHIITGICLPDNPDKVVGIAEMFDYDKKVNVMTIGYKINESYWGQGIATKAVSAMVNYLFKQIGINRIQAFVMTENIGSQKVLLKNDFTKEGVIRQGNFWKGKGVVDLVLFSLLR